jgi:hypothetical protein
MIHGHHAMPALIFNPKDRLPGTPGKKAVAWTPLLRRRIPSRGSIFPDL